AARPVQQRSAGFLRGHRADAARADLRGAAPGLLRERACADGFHRPDSARAAPARPRAGWRAGLRGDDGPPDLAGLAEGGPDLGLPRRDGRPAHRLRPLRLLHGGDDRPGRADSPLSRAGAPGMIEGLVGLFAMMLLAFLRVPISYAMGIVGVIGYAYMRAWNWRVAL